MKNRPSTANDLATLITKLSNSQPYRSSTFIGREQRATERVANLIAVGVQVLGLANLAAPFVTTFRELRELRYLWTTSIKMSNAKLLSVLGHEPHTPLDQAVETTLEGMGCLTQTKHVI